MLSPMRSRKAVPMTSAVQPPARFMPMLGLAYTTPKAQRPARPLTCAPA